LNIRIFYDNVNFRLRERGKIKKLIDKVIRAEGKYSDDLIFIFTEDETIKKINKEFLNHNYYTDVISFDYSEGKILKGEVYIGIETVRNNANNYKISLFIEVLRVMIHGTLHLCGYRDNTNDLKDGMRIEEDKWIRTFRKIK